MHVPQRKLTLQRDFCNSSEPEHKKPLMPPFICHSDLLSELVAMPVTHEISSVVALPPADKSTLVQHAYSETYASHCPLLPV